MRSEFRILVAALLVILPVFLSAQPEPATSKSQVSGWEQLKYGMKYAVLTAKHTGGFCLWDSKVTWKGREYDYDIASSPIKKDIVAQFMESCRKYNIKPALYYCLWDDHNQPISTKDEYKIMIDRQ